jgi:hypothetical protein
MCGADPGTGLETVAAFCAGLRVEPGPDALAGYVAKGDVLAGTDGNAGPASDAEPPSGHIEGILYFLV